MSMLNFDDVTALSVGDNQIIGLKANSKWIWTKAMQWIDLGMKDSNGNTMLWCDRNLGAGTPYDAGWFLAWGEVGSVEEGYVDGIKKYSYEDYSHYRLCDGSSTTFNKYCTSSSQGTADNKTTLEAEDDAATVNLGDDCRITTTSEWSALNNTDNFTWTWDSKNKGFLITSKISGYEGNSIFLYAGGYYNTTSHLQEGELGCYWASTLYRNPYAAMDQRITSNEHTANDQSSRVHGRTIRPVKIVAAS